MGRWKLIRYANEGINIVRNEEEQNEIIDQYWGNGIVEITREQINHLLSGGTLVEVVNQEYTSTIKLKS